MFIRQIIKRLICGQINGLNLTFHLGLTYTQVMSAFH